MFDSFLFCSTAFAAGLYGMYSKLRHDPTLRTHSSLSPGKPANDLSRIGEVIDTLDGDHGDKLGVDKKGSLGNP